ncbi:hypothetical protein GBF38_023244 [Nibea albiflora]|uniref:Uncharacterized protein n=1 Tax=Nibea albiflora TaxID=240163 RepID=A0ACB7EYT9_NIBAL|nr:hypothetical protein GBF38_023244 [Nibea albiflora]
MVKQLLANEEVAHKIARDYAEKDQNLAQSQLARFVAEKEQLEKDIEYYKNYTIDQTGQINHLEHIKATQEQKIKLHEKEIEILRHQTRNILNELSRIPKAPRIRNTTMEKIRRVYPSVQIKQQHLKDLLQVKDKEIEKLKSMLARRPDNAIQKLQKCQWDIRKLKKDAMAQEALLVMYAAKVKSQEEVNSSMSEELRQLRITCKQESRNRTLPPLSKKPQPPPVDKPSDRPKSSCATGFPQRPAYHQSTKPSFNSVRLPPLQLNK